MGVQRTTRNLVASVGKRIAKSNTRKMALLLPILFILTLFVFSSPSSEQLEAIDVGDMQGTGGRQFKGSANRNKKKTLVSMAYHECGQICTRNLQYFLDVGVWKQPEVDFLIIVNGDKCTECERNPRIKSEGVRVLYRENKGFDFAAYSHGLDSVDLDHYEYFIFLNDGVRGPVMPRTSLHAIKSWPTLFTNLLNDEVKLVGPTICCTFQIHIQTHMFATDKVGLRLLSEKGIFNTTNIPIDSKHAIQNVIIHSELGSTTTIMDAGYSVDTFITEYAGFDWKGAWKRNKGQNFCNNGVNPTAPNRWHGGDLDPLDVVFYKQGGSIRKHVDENTGPLCPKGVCSFDENLDRLSAAVEKFVNRR